MAQELVTGGGQQHPARLAFHQLRAELRLKLLDLLRQRGLGDVQYLGGAAERAGVDQGGEIAKVLQGQVHKGKL